MRPLDDQHAHARHVHVVIPERLRLAAHALERDALRPALEGGDDAVHLVKVRLLRRAEVERELAATLLLIDRHEGIALRLRGVCVAILRPERAQRAPHLLCIDAALHQPAQAARAIDTQAFGVVVARNAARVVVAAQNVRADAQRIQIIAQHRGELAFAHAAAAADADDRAAARIKLPGEHAAQRAKDCLRLGDVLRSDADLVPRHIPVGNLLRHSDGPPAVKARSYVVHINLSCCSRRFVQPVPAPWAAARGMSARRRRRTSRPAAPSGALSRCVRNPSPGGA